MNNFETTVLISSDATKNNTDKIDETFVKSVDDLEGTIIGKENWGLRELAYEINGSKKAFYFYYQININGQKIQNLKKNFSQNEKIIRYSFIKVKTHDKLPTKLLQNNEKKSS